MQITKKNITCLCVNRGTKTFSQLDQVGKQPVTLVEGGEKPAKLVA
jgi:hypothetical protein